MDDYNPALEAIEEEAFDEAPQEAAAETEAAPRRRRGPGPRTPEQKEAAARARAERKAKAEQMTPAVYVQYQDSEGDVNELVESAIAAFREEKSRMLITELKLYVKPEERMAYYVINEKFTGKIPY